jgi:membrane protein implicated in regulation of membrane protease activity
VSILVAILLALFVLPSPWGVVAVAVAAAFEVVEAWLFVWWSRRRRPAVGAEALAGKLAKVVTDCLPDGQVRVDGELWRARCDGGARAGETVVVRSVEGLTLVVAR